MHAGLAARFLRVCLGYCFKFRRGEGMNRGDGNAGVGASAFPVAESGGNPALLQTLPVGFPILIGERAGFGIAVPI